MKIQSLSLVLISGSNYECSTRPNKKLIAVQKKMADLLLLEHALEEHLGQCQNNDDDSHCPIIDSLQPK